MLENIGEMSEHLENGTQNLLKKKEYLKGFASFAGEVMEPGALDVKYKSQIAAAIALYAGCKHCMVHHIQEAVEAGATREELIDAMGVAILMGGGVVWASSATFFQNAVEELAIEPCK